MTDVTTGTNMIAQVFTQQSLFGSGLGYVITFLTIGICAIAMSPRKAGNIKTLAFPLGVGFRLIGLNIPMVFLAVLGVLFVVDTLSLPTIGNITEAVTTRAVETFSGTERLKRRKERIVRGKEISNLALHGEGIGMFGKMSKNQKELLKAKKNTELKLKTLREMNSQKLGKKPFRYRKRSYNIIKDIKVDE